MALTCDELIAEVKDYIGRPTDTAVITDTRVLRFLNEGQINIADQVIGLPELEMKNTDSVDTTQVSKYSMTEWTSPLSDVTTENRIAHIKDLWYIDGNESFRMKFYPSDDFDADYPDPTNTDFQFWRPVSYTQRGSYIEVAPVCATEYCNKTLRLDGWVYPTEFTATDSTHTSDLHNCDEGLISYACYHAWAVAGNTTKALEWKGKYDLFVQDLRDNNERLTAWEGNVYD